MTRKPQSYSDQKNWSNDYLTDPALVKLLGPFSVDPCCPRRMPWQTATRMLQAGRDNGLTASWGRGRAFMNPPYRGVVRWAERFVEHGSGVALLNGRSTETRATQLVMENSAAIWFPSGRLTFFQVTGQPWAQKWFPSLLIGLTSLDAEALGRAQAVYGGELYYKERGL